MIVTARRNKKEKSLFFAQFVTSRRNKRPNSKVGDTAQSHYKWKTSNRNATRLAGPRQQTKTPPDLHRGGVLAIAWLLVASSSIFPHASANPSRVADSLVVVSEQRCSVVSTRSLGS